MEWGIQGICEAPFLVLQFFRCYQISSPNFINKFNYCTVYCKSNRKRDVSRFLGILYRENFNRFIATNVSTNLIRTNCSFTASLTKSTAALYRLGGTNSCLVTMAPTEDRSIQKVSFGRSYHRVEIFLYFFAKKMD